MDFHTIGTTIASSEGVDMHVKGPTGRLLYAIPDGDGDGWKLTESKDAEGAQPSTLRVVSTDSDVFRERKDKDLPAFRDLNKRTLQEIEDRGIRAVAAGIIGMKGIVFKGQLMEYSDENVLEFFRVYRPAFEQADRFISDRANFFVPA